MAHEGGDRQDADPTENRRHPTKGQDREFDNAVFHNWPTRPEGEGDQNEQQNRFRWYTRIFRVVGHAGLAADCAPHYRDGKLHGNRAAVLLRHFLG